MTVMARRVYKDVLAWEEEAKQAAKAQHQQVVARDGGYTSRIVGPGPAPAARALYSGRPVPAAPYEAFGRSTRCFWRAAARAAGAAPPPPLPAQTL